MSVNKVILLGNLGDDVKIHHFEDGNCIGKFPIATNETYKNKQTGEKVTEVEWHNIVCRNKAAEVIEKYFKKGDQIYIEGKKKTRKWEDNKGETKYSVDIKLKEFSFVSGGGSDNQSGGQSQKEELDPDNHNDLAF